METLSNEKQVAVLNDLIQVNNDRRAGYDKAISELNDKDAGELEPFLRRIVNDSIDYNTELEKLVSLYEGKTAEGTSGAGKVYRAWMELKALLTGSDSVTILESCETVEATAIRAYNEVLEEELGSDIRRLVKAQKSGIVQAFEDIRNLRNVFNRK
jgi:uncharacterized protein (TIGR02284 family)